MDKASLQKNRLSTAHAICIGHCGGCTNKMAAMLSEVAGFEVSPVVVQGWFKPGTDKVNIDHDYARLLDICLRQCIEKLVPGIGSPSEPPLNEDVLQGLDYEAKMLLMELDKMPQQIQHEIREIIETLIDDSTTERIPE